MTSGVHFSVCNVQQFVTSPLAASKKYSVPDKANHHLNMVCIGLTGLTHSEVEQLKSRFQVINTELN